MTVKKDSLEINKQKYSDDPLNDRDTDHYIGEYVSEFVNKWDELIDWKARAESEGKFFIDVLRSRNKKTILDVATGTGFHSVQLSQGRIRCDFSRWIYGDAY